MGRIRTSVIVEAIEPRRLLAATWYVDAAAPSAGPHDGQSWPTAYRDLQQALAAAAAGDQVRVADGAYMPTAGADRTISFQLKNGMMLLGGYGGYGAPDPDARDVPGTPSVLSGDIGSIGVATDNSYHVVTSAGADLATTLNGFMITGGNANSTTFPNDRGGGAFVPDSKALTLAGCTFTSNASHSSGAGLCAFGGACSVTACTFTSNTTGGWGGGMYVATGPATLIDSTFNNNTASSGGGLTCDSAVSTVVANCTFTGNTAPRGGGIYDNFSSPTLTDTRFVGNDGSGSAGGGGICNDPGSNPSLSRCTFTGNTATLGGGICNNSASPTLTACTFARNRAGYGGAIYNSAPSGPSSPTHRDCRFIGNNATSSGAVYNGVSCAPTFTNCLFSGNSAGSAGAFSDGGSARLTNCVFAGNVASSTGGAFGGNSSIANSTLVNCILWGNAAPTDSQIHPFGGVTLSWCDVQGGFGGSNNIKADPQFVRTPVPGPDNTWGTPDDDYGDVRLLTGSPCINAGSNAAVPAGVTTDLDGNDRIVYGTVDMGSYEWHFPADANGDRTVDLTDFTILAANFNTTGRTFSQGNFDYDAGGRVDLTDFTILAANFNHTMPAASTAAAAMPLSLARVPLAAPKAGRDALFSSQPLAEPALVNQLSI